MSQSTGFTLEEEISLIDFVKMNNVLNSPSPSGSNTNAFKEHLWQQISSQLGKSVNQCKKRWKNIKMAYLKSRNMESESNNKSNKIQLLALHLSFLDVDELNTTSSNTNNIKKDTNEEVVNNEVLNDPPNNEECDPSIEERITMLRSISIALKNLNEFLCNLYMRQMEILNNALETVQIHGDNDNAINIQNNETTAEYVENTNDEIEQVEQGNLQTTSQLTTSHVTSPQLTFNDARNDPSQEVILKGWQREVELLFSKSETTKSLSLFFKSIIKDIEYVSPRGINDLKPRIIKCVSDIREMYSYSDVSLGSVASNLPDKSADDDKVFLNVFKQKVDSLTFETADSMELFFYSVIADIKDFSIRAIDDVKLRILECVSEVKHIYSNQDASSVASSPNATPNYLQPFGSPRNQLNITESPPQGYVVYYNVPFYSNEPSNYIQ